MKCLNPETRIAYVYKITSPTGKVYIGSTVSLIQRKSSYKTLACKSQRRLYNSLKKHGWKAHTFEVIKECLVINMKKVESFYGFMYSCLHPKTGLNCNLPKIDEEFIPISEETRKLLGNGRRGKTHTKEWKDKAAIRMKGNNHCAGSKNRSKLVLNLETGIYYDNAKEACETTNYNPLTFVNMLNPKNKHTNKTQFIYVDEGTKTEHKKSGFNNNNRGRIVLNLENGVFHDSAKEAYEAYPSISRKWTLKTFNGVLRGNVRPKNKTSLIYA